MPVVGRDQLGQLGIGRVRAGLHLVDLLEQAGEQAGGVAADLLVAERQLVEAVEQHRQPLGRAEHVEEGVEAGRGRVLAQQPLAELFPGADPELFERAVEQCLDPLAQALGGGSGRGEDEDAVRRGALLGEALEAPRQHLGLAGSRLADQQERAGAVADRALLGLGKGKHGPTLPRRRARVALHRMIAMDVLSADWPGICRRIVAAQQHAVRADARPRGPHRVRGGGRGRRPQPRHRPPLRGRGLRRAGAAGRGRGLVRRDLRGARRGRLRRRRAGAGRDRPDRRLAQRPPHAALAQPQHRRRLGPLDGRRRVRLRLRLRRRRGVRREPGEGATLDGRPDRGRRRRREAGAARGRVGRAGAPAGRWPRRSTAGSTACGWSARSRSPPPTSPPAGSTGCSACGRAARSTPPPRS